VPVGLERRTLGLWEQLDFLVVVEVLILVLAVHMAEALAGKLTITFLQMYQLLEQRTLAAAEVPVLVLMVVEFKQAAMVVSA
jgi:hypothetical protein